MRTARLSFAEIYFPEDRSNSRFSDHPASKNGAATLFQSIKAIRLAKQPFFRSSQAYSVSDYFFSLVRWPTMCSKSFFSLFAPDRNTQSAFFGSSLISEELHQRFSALQSKKKGQIDCFLTCGQIPRGKKSTKRHF